MVRTNILRDREEIFIDEKPQVRLRSSFFSFYIYPITNLTNPTKHLPHIPQYINLEQQHAHFCSEWCIVGYEAGALWDLWDRSVTYVMTWNELELKKLGHMYSGSTVKQCGSLGLHKANERRRYTVHETTGRPLAQFDLILNWTTWELLWAT